jgi:mannose-6-phosphate isomerase-like protein (cupin superfamily)
MPEFETKQQLPTESKTAPAGSKLISLLKTERGGLSYVTFPPNKVGRAHMNNTVEEIWFFIQGIGEFWRKHGDNEQTVTFGQNTCLTIPPRTHFQYRNLGDEPLVMLIVTMPPFPGDQESVDVKGKWGADIDAD